MKPECVPDPHFGCEVLQFWSAAFEQRCWMIIRTVDVYVVNVIEYVGALQTAPVHMVLCSCPLSLDRFPG